MSWVMVIHLCLAVCTLPKDIPIVRGAAMIGNWRLNFAKKAFNLGWQGPRTCP